MALFIEIKEYPQKGGMIRHVILKNHYTKEELNSLFNALIESEENSEEYRNNIILMGKKSRIFKLKHEAILTTETYEAEKKYHAKDKLIIYPSGNWSVEPHINFLAKVRRIWDAWREDWAKPR